MKRIEIGSPATLETLRLVDVDPPRPARDDLLVRVRASSLNFHDFLVVSGMRPAAPGRVPMSDAVGEVVELGPEVREFAVGDRVLGTFFPDWHDGPPDALNRDRMRGDHVDGFASEYVALPETSFTRAPAGLSDEATATLPCAGLTAWRALFVEGKLRPGHTVLIQGTGGVSILALQLARMAGAQVVGLSSSNAKLERLVSLGAEQVINYRETPEWGAEVRRLTDGGVDHVIEVVGGDLTQSLHALRVGGALHLIGALSRKPAQFPAGLPITNNQRLIAITVGNRKQQAEMVRAIEANGVQPVVDRVFPFADLADAFRLQVAGGHFGKIAVCW